MTQLAMHTLHFVYMPCLPHGGEAYMHHSLQESTVCVHCCISTDFSIACHGHNLL